MFVKPGIEVGQLSPLVLAYVGDAVFELYVRTKLTEHPAKVQDLHAQAVKHVQAAAQAKMVQAWDRFLSDEEKDVVRRGRNAKGGIPRHGTVWEYRHSTGFEALIGYLYLSGQNQRLLELLSLIELSGEA